MTYLRTLAMARIILDNVPNLQSSWVTMGHKVGQIALRFGANDFGSLMMEENVVSAAGHDLPHHARRDRAADPRCGLPARRRRQDYSIIEAAAVSRGRMIARRHRLRLPPVRRRAARSCSAASRFPTRAGLAGHSDADAVAHALTDAILGAAGAGDIGRLFPDTDPQWKDADSMDLLARAHELVRGARLRAASRPTSPSSPSSPGSAPHSRRWPATSLRCLGLAAGDVSIKAKTNEGMGFIGRGEGLAVIAVATVEAR